jgi:hypothetical protein
MRQMRPACSLAYPARFAERSQRISSQGRVGFGKESSSIALPVLRVLSGEGRIREKG